MQRESGKSRPTFSQTQKAAEIESPVEGTINVGGRFEISLPLAVGEHVPTHMGSKVAKTYNPFGGQNAIK